MPPCRSASPYTIMTNSAADDAEETVVSPLYSCPSTPLPPELSDAPSTTAPQGGLPPPASPTASTITTSSKASRRPTSKRMPRDPVTNQRICYDFVRGCCPRAAEACRYAHTSPPVLLGAFWRRTAGSGGASSGTWDLTALQQALTRYVKNVPALRMGARSFPPAATGRGRHMLLPHSPLLYPRFHPTQDTQRG